jgi:hypothetical protein
MKMNAMPSAWRNRVFLKIWLASLVSGTAVAANDTAATWMMNLMSPSGLFISLISSSVTSCGTSDAHAGALTATLAASELWVIAQRAIPNSARGRISALIMVLSQGAMTLSAIAWGMTAQIAGTRLNLFAAAFLFCVTSVVLMLLFKIPREQSGSPDETEAFARLKGSLDAC